jgi:hypothetical protein
MITDTLAARLTAERIIWCKSSRSKMNDKQLSEMKLIRFWLDEGTECYR